MLIFGFKYRPEIDGLRALAILAVVLYHAGFGFPGGYVGVDVFFVISGYLITSLIVKDIEAGKFSMVDFWARRSRRILPALFFVVLTSLAIGWFVLLPSDLGELGRSTAWQSVFAANLFFWRNTGYFGGETVEKPLLHTWSLAVEEQFYLLIPFILLVTFRFARVNKRRALLRLIGAGAFLSLIVSVILVRISSSAAFFLLPARAWELLFGSFVALLPPSVRNLGWRNDLMCWIGCGLIVVPIIAYTEQTLFPGLAAVPPCLGAAFLIWFGDKQEHGKQAVVARFFSVRPIVFIGLISYSLYLWHWPLLAFGHYLNPFRELNVGYRISLVVISFGCAIFSYKFIETPFRLKRLLPSPVRILCFGGAGLASLFLLGTAFSFLKGIPNRWSDAGLKYDQVKLDLGYRLELTPEDLQSGKVPTIGADESHDKISVVIWGDSHAMAAVPALTVWLKENRLSGSVVTRSSTPPLLDYEKPNKWHNVSNEAFSRAAFQYIKKTKAHIAILIASWDGHAGHESSKSSKKLEAAMLRTVKALREEQVTPWIVTNLPMQSIDVPKALALSERFGWDYEPYLARPDGSNGLGGTSKEFLDTLRSYGVKIIDLRKNCLTDDGTYGILEDGVVVYRDFHHFTPAGAKQVFLPALRERNNDIKKSGE